MKYPVGEHIQLAQGTPEWITARVGSLGASQIADALATTRSGFAASRANIMSTLLVERLTGQSVETYTNEAMRRGTEKEPDARMAYEFAYVTVEQVGLFKHPTILGSHASPDGLIGDEGAVEIKCPNTATHIDTILSEKVAGRYLQQVQWQMACAGREWIDFVSFDDRVPPELRLFVKRIHRDDVMIANMEKEITAFLAELEDKLAHLQKRFARAA